MAIDVEDILLEARNYEAGKGFAAFHHPCRNWIRESLYNKIPIYRIHKLLIDKETGKPTITIPALRSYRDNPKIKESIKIEYDHKKEIAKEDEFREKHGNIGINLMEQIIEEAGNIPNFRKMTDEEERLMKLAIQASGKLPALRKSEPEVVHNERINQLDITAERLVKPVADFIARTCGAATSTKPES